MLPHGLNRADEQLRNILALERQTLEGNNAVLVSVDSIAGLKKAYPNYFLDTNFSSKLWRRPLASDDSTDS
jgi:hypothetical protein